MYPINTEENLLNFIKDNEELLNKIVVENKELILKILSNESPEQKQLENERNDLQIEKHKFNEKIQTERKQLQLEREKLEQLTNLQKGINQGVSSYHIGEFTERNLEESMKQDVYFKEGWSIDTDKKTKCMDIRLTRNDTKMSVGIELKNKTKIISEDIKKFKRDMTENNFHLGIFISVRAPIANILSNEGVYIDNKNMYIVSPHIKQIIDLR